MTRHEILKKYWGFDEFRPLQEDIIQSVLDKKDVLAILPTGGGKSLCFQVPALMTDGLCIVITPLIALMKDQVSNLKKKGIASLSVHSGLRFREVKEQFEKAMKGECKFLYVSPERLETQLFLEYLPFLNINLIAVDEAHCISQWGYDFRPSYLKIAAIKTHLPDVPVLALTASATKRVQADIWEKLEFGADSRFYSKTYDRPNLSYSVFVPPSKENKTVEIFQKVPGTAIAYCRSRKRTKELATMLNIHSINSDFYHAGLPTDIRSKKQDNWIQNQTRVICSTNAFGMGIDKPDVRSVVHFDVPEALEYYYQEAGRAGRDGKKSYAVLLYQPQDIENLRAQVSLRFPALPEIRSVFSSLCSFIQLPAGKGRGLAFDFELEKFIENYRLNPILAVSVLKILEQEEVLMLSDNTFTPSTVEIFASKETLEVLENDMPVYTKVIKGLLRSYDGILGQSCFIDEFILARFAGLKKEAVIRQLTELDKMKIIEYVPRGDVPRLYFPADRVPADDLLINEKNISLRRKAYEERLNAMIEYATQTSVCRSIFINDYFGGEKIEPCGICDVCLSKARKQLSTPEIETIIRAVRQNPGIRIEEIESKTKLHKTRILEALYFLKQENAVSVNEDGQVYYIQKITEK